MCKLGLLEERVVVDCTVALLVKFPELLFVNFLFPLEEFLDCQLILGYCARKL